VRKGSGCKHPAHRAAVFIEGGGLCAERAGYRKPDAVTVHAVGTVTRGAE